MTVDTPSRSRRVFRARFYQYVPPSSIRGRRESRVPIAPVGPVQKKHGGRTTGSTGNTPAFPARWFTAYFALSPVTGLVCHRRLRNRFRELDASVGASGPHDFAVRLSAVRHRRIRVHRIPPRGRDDRVSPLCGTGPNRSIPVSTRTSRRNSENQKSIPPRPGRDNASIRPPATGGESPMLAFGSKSPTWRDSHGGRQ